MNYTVAEIIEALSKFNPKAAVVFSMEDTGEVFMDSETRLLADYVEDIFSNGHPELDKSNQSEVVIKLLGQPMHTPVRPTPKMLCEEMLGFLNSQVLMHEKCKPVGAIDGEPIHLSVNLNLTEEHLQLGMNYVKENFLIPSAADLANSIHQHLANAAAVNFHQLPVSGRVWAGVNESNGLSIRCQCEFTPEPDTVLVTFDVKFTRVLRPMSIM